ncbi:hypothetical protein [Paracoccus alkanivorans]|uniref:hypothetical protein n=1 Tax=Paracoccus alkanivorans TaxID=2116655 RepID=UPI001FB7C798|nr:hypothetical protein [Paracoccus alkanivorans]
MAVRIVGREDEDLRWYPRPDSNRHGLLRRVLNLPESQEKQSDKENSLHEQTINKQRKCSAGKFANNPPGKKENPAALGGATELEDIRRKSDGLYIWGGAIARLSLADSLSLKPQGYFRIETRFGETTITVHRPGELEQVIICLSPGHANQLRQELSDAGMCGLIEGAL